MAASPRPAAFGRWVLIEGRQCRCSRCGRMATSTWRWCPRPGLWTNPLCGDCVDALLEESA